MEYFWSEGAVLYVDCGGGYKTLYIHIWKFTELSIQKLVNFTLYILKIIFKYVYICTYI